ncbi:MAG: FHA domain-containing protein [Lachnospiraceae bacterium]|nr:FHA domain-containing protein [Lachnospiraceae bacterium]
MSKCIVCECASVLYYQPPQERPPVVCPHCGRDTRRYPSMKVDDPRVGRLVAEYRSRSMQDGKTDEAAAADGEKPAYENPAGEQSAAERLTGEGFADGRSSGEELVRGRFAGEGVATGGDAEAGFAAGGTVTEGYAAEASVGEQAGAGKKIYCLVSADRSYRIAIPEGGGVIGRTAIGGEELAHNGRVSREHIRVMPAKRVEGIMVEDISANGTFLNGKRLIAQKQEFAVVGSEIKLFNEAFTLEVCDER